VRGRARGVGPGQQRGEQAAGDRQTDALGLGGTGEGSQAVPLEENSGVEDRLEFGEVVAEFGDLLVESLELLGGQRSIEGLQDPLGVPVKGLAGETLLEGPSADSAVGSVEDRGRIGDAELGG
jgi:hypothetical protein